MPVRSGVSVMQAGTPTTAPGSRSRHCHCSSSGGWLQSNGPCALLWADPSLTARPPHRPFPSWVGLPPGGRRQPLITAWWCQCLHSALPAFQHGVNSPCGARSVCSTHCGVLLLPHPGGHAPCTSVFGYIHLPRWASDAIGQGHVCPLIFASPCLAQSRAHGTSARTHGLCGCRLPLSSQPDVPCALSPGPRKSSCCGCHTSIP